MIVTALNYDPFYFEQLLVMLTSLKFNSPKDIASIFLIDFPKVEIEKLNKTFVDFEFVDRKLNISNLRDIAGFMVCYRTLVVKECLERYKKPVAWFDTDIIVRKSLDIFWSDVKTNQLKIFYRGDKVANNCKFQAGVFAVGYSEETLRYISDWNDVVQSKKRWYEDQLQLYLLYNKYSDKIQLIDMPIEFNDTRISKGKNSTLWHCKKGHFNEKQFRKEYLKYLKEAKKIFK
jgi:hypothetical protein